MFTGIIKELGQISSIRPNVEGRELVVRSKKLLPLLEIDDSIAINGVCQTVIEKSEESFTVQAVLVTLEKTTLGKIKENEVVNLECALTPQDRLGGHFVQGHVNGMGRLNNISNQGNNYLLEINVPQEISSYLVQEGSVALEGISLTIAYKKNDTITVSIIPHTWLHTNLHLKRRGDFLNVEVDILAKYVESFLKQGKSTQKNEKTETSWGHLFSS